MFGQRADGILHRLGKERFRHSRWHGEPEIGRCAKSTDVIAFVAGLHDRFHARAFQRENIGAQVIARIIRTNKLVRKDRGGSFGTQLTGLLAPLEMTYFLDSERAPRLRDLATTGLVVPRSVNSASNAGFRAAQLGEAEPAISRASTQREAAPKARFCGKT